MSEPIVSERIAKLRAAIAEAKAKRGGLSAEERAYADECVEFKREYERMLDEAEAALEEKTAIVWAEMRTLMPETEAITVVHHPEILRRQGQGIVVVKRLEGENAAAALKAIGRGGTDGLSTYLNDAKSVRAALLKCAIYPRAGDGLDVAFINRIVDKELLFAGCCVREACQLSAQWARTTVGKSES